MKKSATILFLLLLSLKGYSQVGIGTTSPAETLHVSGTMRIESTAQKSVITTKIGGLDNFGTFRQIDIGSFLVLTDNKLSTKNPSDEYFGSISLPIKDNDNVNLLMGPGETNEGKSIIRIFNDLLGDSIITGIAAGYDGQHVWLYPQNGKIDLKSDDVNSLPANRIEVNSLTGGNVYCMIEIVYDSVRGKWIIMQH